MSSAYTDSRILKGMEIQLKLRQKRLDAGEKAIGWKVGFGAPASMESLGIDAPLVGFMTDKSILAPDSEVSIAKWVKPVVEPEIAIRFGIDIAGAVDRETAKSAISAMIPSIELADVDIPPTDIEKILEANIFHRSILLAENSRDGFSLNGLTGRIFRDGTESASVTALEGNTGDIIDIVRHLAHLLDMFGEKISAGDILITGSITPPIMSTASETVRFFLDPIGDVTVKVTV
jgi:2-keto-4-pentenoate hydratase